MRSGDLATTERWMERSERHHRNAEYARVELERRMKERFDNKRGPEKRG